MKKLVSFLIIAVLLTSGFVAIGSSEGKQVICEQQYLTFSAPETMEQQHVVTISIDEGTTNSVSAGEPDIPVVTKVFTYPLGTTIEQIEVTFSGETEYKLSKPIAAVPQYHITSIEHAETEIDYDVIPCYEDLDVYPEKRYSYRTGAGIYNGERVLFVTVYLYPVQYDHSSLTISSAENAQIDLSLVLPKQTMNNPDVYDLLVLTPDDFSEVFFTADSEFDVSYVDYKESKGVKTTVVTLSDIYTSKFFPVEGVDNQEKIKYFIKDAIDNWGITNVLIIGSGVHGNERFPVRQAWIGSGNYEDYFPSDLYYADIYNSEMGFSHWDNDSDGRYAEFRSSRNNDMVAVDIYPDVYLGRLPCNNVDEVKDIIHKILYYEIHNKMTNKIVQIGGDTFPGDGERINEGEYANEYVLNILNGYSSTQLWASNGGLTKQNIANGFKDGVDFMDFSGHGSWAAWSTHDTNNDEVWLPPDTLISPYTGFLYIDFDFYFINNNVKFPVAVYNACSCHKYSEHETCMGWKTVGRSNGGSIASFGAAGIGYGGHGTGEIQRVFGWMAVNIFRELYNTKVLGQVWANSVTGYANAFAELDDGDYKTLLEMSMFGDPTVVIDDGDDPKSISSETKFPLFSALFARFNDKSPIRDLIQYFIESYMH